jgi:hypothetical protein
MRKTKRTERNPQDNFSIFMTQQKQHNKLADLQHNGHHCDCLRVLGDGRLLTNVDAVKEFANVLVLDGRALLDARGCT